MRHITTALLLAACLITIGVFVAARTNTPEISEYAIVTYTTSDYKIYITFAESVRTIRINDDFRKDLVEILNSLDDEGYELVSTTASRSPTIFDSNWTEYNYVLRHR